MDLVLAGSFQVIVGSVHYDSHIYTLPQTRNYVEIFQRYVSSLCARFAVKLRDTHRIRNPHNENDQTKTVY